MMTLYRVARIADDGTFESLWPPHPRLVVRHRLGKMVHAPVGGLLVFEDERRAREFLDDLEISFSAALLKVEGWDVVPIPRPWRPDYLFGDPIKEARRYWAGRMIEKECRVLGYWPKGTTAVSRFVATKVIEERRLS